MNTESKKSKLVVRVQEAHQKLLLKVLTFSEAYIFVLEGSAQSARKLKSLAKESSEKKRFTIDPKTIQASFVRLSHLLRNHGMETSEYFRSILFVDLISSTEVFFADLIRAVVAEYPHKIGRIQFELKDVLEASSPSELVLRAAEEFIHKLMYEKPEDYLEKMCNTLSIEVDQIKPYWSKYIEAKARRDLGVHNNWKCNKTYLRKVAAGPLDGEATEGV